MAGKIQHEIPQLFLRGFLIPRADGVQQVYVYRRGRTTPFISGIDRVAAEGYFYSRLATDSSKTLDDQITEYENRLRQLVAELRSVPTGTIAPSAIVAEVVAHLTTRNAHLRGTFAQAVRSIANHARTIFGSQDAVLRLLGLDEPEPTDRFYERFGDTLNNDSTLAQLGLPEPMLGRVAFFLAKENFESTTSGYLTPLKDMLGQLDEMAPDMARNGHNKVLSSSLAPAPRVQSLSALEWRADAAQSDLILPDCVAIAREAGGDWKPLMMADPDEVQTVILPLSSRVLLIGYLRDTPPVDVAEFNAAAAACCQTYFLSGSRSVELESLLPTLGCRALTVVEDAIRSSVYGVLPSPQSALPPTGEPAIQAEIDSDTNRPPPKVPLSIAIAFHGDFDNSTRNRIADATAQIVGEACWTIPLDRLDGITFADNYPEALRFLDRGFPAAKPLETYQSELGIGIAQSPLVLRNGVVKGHVVMDGVFARNLVREDALCRSVAVHALVKQLALIGCIQIFDDALPGILLNPFKDCFDHDMQVGTYPGWNGYFASRAAAAFNSSYGKAEAEVLANGLREAKEGVPSSRLAYRQHGDLVQLFQEILPRLAFVLEHAGNLLGHCDGLDTAPLDNEPELVALLEEMGLRNWLDSYHRQLAELWNRRGEWASFDEFLTLNRHTERLLWRFGIFPWRVANGGYRVEIPLATDAVKLLKITIEAQRGVE